MSILINAKQGKDAIVNCAQHAVGFACSVGPRGAENSGATTTQTHEQIN